MEEVWKPRWHWRMCAPAQRVSLQHKRPNRRFGARHAMHIDLPHAQHSAVAEAGMAASDDDDHAQHSDGEDSVNEVRAACCTCEDCCRPWSLSLGAALDARRTSCTWWTFSGARGSRTRSSSATLRACVPLLAPFSARVLCDPHHTPCSLLAVEGHPHPAQQQPPAAAGAAHGLPAGAGARGPAQTHGGRQRRQCTPASVA